MTTKPPCWPPQPDDGLWVDCHGAQWLAVSPGKVRRLGDDDPGALYDADDVWTAVGPLIPPLAARQRAGLAAHLRREAHEVECDPFVLSHADRLDNADRLYRRADELTPDSSPSADTPTPTFQEATP